MAEFDTAAIIVAIISAGTSALATVLTLYVTRKNNTKLEELKKEHNEEMLHLEENLKRETGRLSLQEKLVNNYLLQLQDAVESLWGRLDNIKTFTSSQAMKDPYYEMSTLYALACLLAYNRILLLDGVYAQIESLRPSLGVALRKKLQEFDFSLDTKIPGAHFYRYNRLALAETVMERVEGRLVVRSYIEFSKQYEKEEIKKAAFPAKSFVFQIPNQELDTLMEDLMAISVVLGKETGITPSIQEIVEKRRKAKEEQTEFTVKSNE